MQILARGNIKNNKKGACALAHSDIRCNSENGNARVQRVGGGSIQTGIRNSKFLRFHRGNMAKLVWNGCYSMRRAAIIFISKKFARACTYEIFLVPLRGILRKN